MNDNPSCLPRTAPDYSGVTVAVLASPLPFKDYRAAMKLAMPRPPAAWGATCSYHGMTATGTLSRPSIPASATRPAPCPAMWTTA